MCVCIISFRQVLALVLNDLLTTDSEHWIESSKSVVTWNIIIWKEKIKPQSCKSPLSHKIYSLLSCSWLQVKTYIVEIKEYVMFHITCFSIGLCFQRSFPYFYIVECVNSNGILLTIKFTYCDLLIDLIISKYLGHLSSLAIRHSLVLAIFINYFLSSYPCSILLIFQCDIEERILNTVSKELGWVLTCHVLAEDLLKVI